MGACCGSLASWGLPAVPYRDWWPTRGPARGHALLPDDATCDADGGGKRAPRTSTSDPRAPGRGENAVEASTVSAAHAYRDVGIVRKPAKSSHICRLLGAPYTARIDLVISDRNEIWSPRVYIALRLGPRRTRVRCPPAGQSSAPGGAAPAYLARRALRHPCRASATIASWGPGLSVEAGGARSAGALTSFPVEGRYRSRLAKVRSHRESRLGIAWLPMDCRPSSRRPTGPILSDYQLESVELTLFIRPGDDHPSRSARSPTSCRPAHS